jgi:uncharacterized membrane protein YidH (DUF202 family)
LDKEDAMSDSQVVLLVSVLLVIGVGGLVLVMARAFLLQRRRAALGGVPSTSTSTLFYLSVVLLVVGFLALVPTIAYNSGPFGIVSVVGILGGVGLRWYWRFRKLSGD